MEDPSFTLDYKGDCLYDVKVSVPGANTRKAAEEVYSELEEHAELPGFRRGKAPRRLIERKYAKAVRSDVTEKVVSASFRKLLEVHKLKPIAAPKIEGLEGLAEIEEEKALEFTLNFEVSPRCELGSYRGVSVERPVLKIADKQVEEAIDNMRGRFALYEPTDAKAQDGDQVVINFTGTVNGEEFAGGSAENYPYILGSKRFFPEFEAALEGVKAGQETTANVTFPETYTNAGLAGKTATFAITVNEVKRKSLPEVNDEFAKQCGFDDVASMRTKVESDLREGASAQSNAIAEGRAIAKIVEDSTFELPKSLIAASTEDYFQQELRRLVQLRVPASQITEQEAEIRKGAEEAALRDIKAFAVINEIGEAEGITIDESDFEEEAEQILQRTGMNIDIEAVTRYIQAEDRQGEYEGRIFRRKALKVIMDNAKITDKEVTSEELSAEA